jgi:hypothetical protein
MLYRDNNAIYHTTQGLSSPGPKKRLYIGANQIILKRFTAWAVQLFPGFPLPYRRVVYN